ncbi:hypothetical protein PoB_001160700 [Plakobranchus ocellatus]|uniref:Uncharacterized protein n=1 Tax=Plakobranchus ocellatus TaxID=259542 RepID=A0AAV3YSI1_9GAST|nr:hypothetical protein PoB_001160700 [Plakobranchus ocellatus]
MSHKRLPSLWQSNKYFVERKKREIKTIINNHSTIADMIKKLIELEKKKGQMLFNKKLAMLVKKKQVQVHISSHEETLTKIHRTCTKHAAKLLQRELEACSGDAAQVNVLGSGDAIQVGTAGSGDAAQVDVLGSVDAIQIGTAGSGDAAQVDVLGSVDAIQVETVGSGDAAQVETAELLGSGDEAQLEIIHSTTCQVEIEMVGSDTTLQVDGFGLVMLVEVHNVVSGSVAQIDHTGVSSQVPENTCVTAQNAPFTLPSKLKRKGRPKQSSGGAAQVNVLGSVDAIQVETAELLGSGDEAQVEIIRSTMCQVENEMKRIWQPTYTCTQSVMVTSPPPQQACTSEPQDHHPYPSRGALRAAVSRIKRGITKNKLAIVIKQLISTADNDTKDTLRKANVCISPMSAKLKKPIKSYLDKLKKKRDKTSIMVRRDILAALPSEVFSGLGLKKSNANLS